VPLTRTCPAPPHTNWGYSRPRTYRRTCKRTGRPRSATSRPRPPRMSSYGKPTWAPSCRIGVTSRSGPARPVRWRFLPSGFAIGRGGLDIGGYGGSSPRVTTVRARATGTGVVSASGRGPWEPPASGRTQQNPSRWGFVGIRSVMTACHHDNTRRRYFDTHRCYLPLWATRFGKRYTAPNFFSREGRKSDTVSRNPTSESSVILLSVRTLLRG
jgi:hypothetical protein